MSTESRSIANELYEKARDRYGESYAEGNERSKAWNHAVTYPDWEHLILAAGPPGRQVDVVGCGIGGFAEWLADRVDGEARIETVEEQACWDVVGYDPADEVAAYAHHFPFHHKAYEEMPREPCSDVVICHDVLEHLTPIGGEAMLQRISERLRPGGVLMLGVPHDDTPLQEAVRTLWGLPRWWRVPEHRTYYREQEILLKLSIWGFELVEETTTFPMEVFALLGELYPLDRDVGRKCHERRVSLECSMSPVRRRAAYKILAQAGLGRHVIVIARRP